MGLYWRDDCKRWRVYIRYPGIRHVSRHYEDYKEAWAFHQQVMKEIKRKKREEGEKAILDDLSL